MYSTCMCVNIQILVHKDNLGLQYRGQEPKFSCQFQSSSTGSELALLLSGTVVAVVTLWLRDPRDTSFLASAAGARPSAWTRMDWVRVCEGFGNKAVIARQPPSLSYYPTNYQGNYGCLLVLMLFLIESVNLFTFGPEMHLFEKPEQHSSYSLTFYMYGYTVYIHWWRGQFGGCP